MASARGGQDKETSHVSEQTAQVDSLAAQSDASEKAQSKAASKSTEQSQDTSRDKQEGQEKKPPGGFDSTPLPKAPPGYTVKITFHKATNLPMADLNSLSSDPYVLAQVNTGLETRHKEDPALRMRTPTIRKNTNPKWNWEWIVANIPGSGFKLKARVYDEDPADHDDRLGNVHIAVNQIDEHWPGIKNQSYKVKKRMGSKRAYAIRAFATCFSKEKHMSGDLYISVEVLGRTEDQTGGRAYTVGPCWSTRHFSPLLGRITGRKAPGDDNKDEAKKTEKYNFQANQFQLKGPVPAELYHRYVEFKPFVKSMFTSKGVRGWVLGKALHHQHTRVYNFDRKTEWDHFEHPSQEMTKKFLDLVHYDRGGRIFTYVLTLDSLLRFTETGKEFGIDMLSKHTMHSDVSIYIAFSGEFFVRRLKHPHRSDTDSPEDEPTHPPDDIGGGPPNEDPPTDPAYYELVIDNDSGTYRPNAQKLDQLRAFLRSNFVGLKIVTLDSQADADKMAKMKQEQRDRKEAEGDNIVFRQGSTGSSISSSDEEELDAMEAGDEQGRHHHHPTMHRIGKEAQHHGQAKKEHFKDYRPRKGGPRQAAEEEQDAAESRQGGDE
ncbi:hypothetical protein LTR39_001478 [Cryomyces antarcticus]|nr:hypothetical protein LTR39_001478 [Cryomyces antarcticus]